MKLYRLTFVDISEGFVIRYARTKREAQRIAGSWKNRFPMRELMENKQIEIPGVRSTDKSAFVNFLNREIGRKEND
jgi:hypothetical protein